MKKFLSNLRFPPITKSKRFWVALIGLGAMTATPDNANVEMLNGIVEIQDAVLVIVLALIGGYTVQDTASALKGENKYTESEG